MVKNSLKIIKGIVYIEIGQNLTELKEYHTFNNNEEEVKIKLYVKEKEKEIDISYIFYDCINLKSIFGISCWKTKIIKVDYMFYNCPLLSSLPDLLEWDVSELKEIGIMFYNCYSLLPIPDLSKWIEKNEKLSNQKKNLFIGFSFPGNDLEHNAHFLIKMFMKQKQKKE